MDTDQLQQLEQNYTSYLKPRQEQALALASAIEGRELSLSSFHAQIGGKNRTFTDVAREEFSDPEVFLRSWLEGLRRRALVEDEEDIAKYGRPYRGRQANRMIKLLQDEFLWDYIRHFLERNFYRNFIERVRQKPGQNLWALWFGANPMVWGLLITPEVRNGKWRTDVSELRRAPYRYWTIGHVLKEGLIDPAQSQPYRFSSIGELMQFYRSVLKRQSNSLYEQAIIDRYEEYLTASSEPENEPFLVPELRYAGLERQHVYRLDFSVLNSHVMEFTGFELSPASSHMAVAGVKNRTQADVNSELEAKWEKEISKRQEYFDGFGIRVETFTDSHLADPDVCFSRIAKYMAARLAGSRSVESLLAQLRTQ